MFTADEITGMFISMMFAGHHTSSRHRGLDADRAAAASRAMLADIIAELDELYADDPAVSFQALREIPLLEAAIKEALRLHPPLILLLRAATSDLRIADYEIPRKRMVGASPSDLEPHRRGLPRPGRVRPAAVPRTRARRTWSTAGPGSRSAPDVTGASAPTSR